MGFSTEIALGTPWSEVETAFLKEFYREHDTHWIAEQLGREYSSVVGKVNDLHLRKAPWGWRYNRGDDRAFAEFKKKFKE